MAQNLITIMSGSIFEQTHYSYSNRTIAKSAANKLMFPYCIKPNGYVLSVNPYDHTDYSIVQLPNLDTQRVLVDGTLVFPTPRTLSDRKYTRFAIRKGREVSQQMFLWASTVEVFDGDPGNRVNTWVVWRSDDDGATWNDPVEIYYFLGWYHPWIDNGKFGDFILSNESILYSVMPNTRKINPWDQTYPRDITYLYSSEDFGDTWTELETLRELYSRNVTAEYNENDDTLLLASAATYEAAVSGSTPRIAYRTYNIATDDYNPVIALPTASYDAISADWTGSDVFDNSTVSIRSIDVDNSGSVWFSVAADFKNGYMLMAHSMSLGETIPSEATGTYVGYAGSWDIPLETLPFDMQGRVDSDGNMHQFIIVSSSFYVSKNFAPFTESVFTGWTSSLSFGKQYIGLPRDTRHIGNGEIIVYTTYISASASHSAVYLIDDFVGTSSIVIPEEFEFDNYTGSLTTTERSEFIVEMDKVPAEIDFIITGSSQSGSRIYLDAELYSFFRVPASMSKFEYRKTSSGDWSPGTVSSYQVADLGAIPLSGKTKNVDLIWEGGIDLGATQSYDDAQLRIQFAESQSGVNTEAKIYDMSTIDFRPPIGAPILRPYPSEPDFVVKFQNGIGPIKVREHYLLEVDTADTFLTSSAGYWSIYSGDSTTNWLASGSTFPTGGVVSTTSSLDTIEVTYTGSLLTNKPQNTYYVRVTRNFFNL